eukprot:scaffold274016_cov50-Prasinocladus_malaysianus.AAC.2
MRLTHINIHRNRHLLLPGPQQPVYNLPPQTPTQDYRPGFSAAHSQPYYPPQQYPQSASFPGLGAADRQPSYVPLAEQTNPVGHQPAGVQPQNAQTAPGTAQETDEYHWTEVSLDTDFMIPVASQCFTPDYIISSCKQCDMD